MTALYAALLLGQPAQGLKSSEVISKVLAKYAEAKTGVGEFVMTQTTQGKKVSIKSELQFERPSKIFLHQSSETVAPNDWLLISDGINFGYDAPGNQARKRLFEPVAVVESATGNKKVLKVHSLYLASKRSLGDNLNPFIEFATQSAGDDQSVKGFLTRLHNFAAVPAEKTLADGTAVYSIGGTMYFGNPILDADGKPKMDDKGNPVFDGAGRFEMSVTKDFSLAQFRTTEQVSLTDTATNLPTTAIIVTTWTGKLQVDGPTANGIFTVK